MGPRDLPAEIFWYWGVLQADWSGRWQDNALFAFGAPALLTALVGLIVRRPAGEVIVASVGSSVLVLAGWVAVLLIGFEVIEI